MAITWSAAPAANSARARFSTPIAVLRSPSRTITRAVAEDVDVAAFQGGRLVRPVVAAYQICRPLSANIDGTGSGAAVHRLAEPGGHGIGLMLTPP